MTDATRLPSQGKWQLPVFGLSLVLALLVWEIFPEPEESRQGYTPSGCYEKARQYFGVAMLSGDVYRKSEALAAAIKYFEALEERFGVSRQRVDAYEMMGDAHSLLALVSEAEPDIGEQLRLRPVEEMRAEALRAFREAQLRLDGAGKDGLRLRRKEAEALLVLARPVDALRILNELIRVYRASDIERLRRERESGLAAAPSDRLTGEGADEARAVYFLAGEAARAAKRFSQSLEQRAVAAGRGTEALRHREAARRHSEEMDTAFSLFLGAGGAGERRAQAEIALGDLKFERAASSTRRGELLLEARNHYRSAETIEAEFLLARTYFALGEFAEARNHFETNRLPPADESRARRYMVARCRLALGEAEKAHAMFVKLRDDNPKDPEGAAALVDLAEIALATGDHKEAARLLSKAVAVRHLTGKGFDLPERDERLEAARLAERMYVLAASFERRGSIDDAIDMYRRAGDIDPEGPENALRRTARAFETKAEGESDRSALVHAGEAYVRLAVALDVGERKREALRASAESFARGGAISRAVVVARRFIADYPDDEFASRLTHRLGVWESDLGLAADAVRHLRRNIETHDGDVYADHSKVELAMTVAASDETADLGESRRLLRSVLEDARYAAASLIRLEALFVLGRVDLRLAERTTTAADATFLLEEAVGALEEALAVGPERLRAGGKGARPLFAELVARRRPAALLDRGVALYRLGRHADSKRDLREAFEAGAGPLAALYESLSACQEADRGGDLLAGNAAAFAGSEEEAWVLTCAALHQLKSGDAPAARVAADHAGRVGRDAYSGLGLLAPRYWRRWSSWLGSRAEEGISHGR